MMNVAACCLAVAGALLSIFQPMSMPILPFLKGSFFDLLIISLKTMTNPTMRYLFNAGNGNWSFAWTLLAIVFGLAALGIWGGRRALKREGGKVPIIFNAMIYLAVFILPNIAVRSSRFSIPFWVLKDFGLWGGLYAAAAVCAILDKPDSETSQTSQEPSKDLDKQSESEPLSVSAQPLQEVQKSVTEEPAVKNEPLSVLDSDEESTVEIKTTEPEAEIDINAELSAGSEMTVNLEEGLEAVVELIQTEQKELSENIETETAQTQETHADSHRPSKNINAGLVLAVVIALPALCYGGYKWLEKHDRQIREETRKEVLASVQYEKRNNTPNKQEVSIKQSVPQVIKKNSTNSSSDEDKAKSILSEPEIPKATSQTPVPMSIRGTKINLRRSPDINSKSDLLLDEGTPIKVLRQEAQGDNVWLFIRLESGKEGWIFGDYAQEKLNEVGEHGGDFMAIKGMDVNLRKGPNKKTTSVAKLNDGNLVEVMYYKFQNDGRWYFVHTLNGQSGWIFGNYLRNRKNF